MTVVHVYRYTYANSLEGKARLVVEYSNGQILGSKQISLKRKVVPGVLQTWWLKFPIRKL
jgi:hypothetical protein